MQFFAHMGEERGLAAVQERIKAALPSAEHARKPACVLAAIQSLKEANVLEFVGQGLASQVSDIERWVGQLRDGKCPFVR